MDIAKGKGFLSKRRHGRRGHPDSFCEPLALLCSSVSFGNIKRSMLQMNSNIRDLEETIRLS